MICIRPYFRPLRILTNDEATTVLAIHSSQWSSWFRSLLKSFVHANCNHSSSSTVCKSCCRYKGRRRDRSTGNFHRATPHEGASDISRLIISLLQNLPDVTEAHEHEVGLSELKIDLKAQNASSEVRATIHTKPRGVYRFYVHAMGPIMHPIYLGLGMIYAFLYYSPCKS